MTHRQTPPTPEHAFAMDARTQAEAVAAHGKAARPSFKKKLLILPLLLILVMVIFQAVSGDDPGSSNTARSDSAPAVTIAPPADAAVARIGTRVQDGTFEFVVTGIERPGKTFEGKLGSTLTAQGEFVIVRVNVTNIGTEAQALDCRCQLLFNDKGRTFSPSPAILSTKEALKFVNLIHPGSTVEGALVMFDVTPGTKVLVIELHDSPFTAGAIVKLT